MKYYCPYCGIRIKKNQKKCERCNYQFRKIKYKYDENHSTEKTPLNLNHETHKMNRRRRFSIFEISYVVLVTFLVILLVILLYMLASNIILTMGHHI